MTRLIPIFIALLFLSGCSTRFASTEYRPQKPTKTYDHATMRPYTVHGKRYYPSVVRTGERLRGEASWYGPNFHGKLTSNGERYNMYAMTAAHKTLPMNTVVRVTNRKNGKSAVVRINDRGPFVDARIIDLSKAAASKIDMIGSGTASVELVVLGFEPEGSTGISDLSTLGKGPAEKFMTSYAAQIGSFSDIEGAITIQEKYDGTDGYNTIIKDTQYRGDRIFKVWVTGFKSEAEVKDYIRNGRFKYAFIVRER
jgi:rare lipoprotein A